MPVKCEVVHMGSSCFELTVILTYPEDRQFWAFKNHLDQIGATIDKDYGSSAYGHELTIRASSGDQARQWADQIQ